MNLFLDNVTLDGKTRLPRQLYHEQYVRLRDWLLWFVDEQGHVVDTEGLYVRETVASLEQKQNHEGKLLGAGWIRFTDGDTLQNFRAYYLSVKAMDDPEIWMY